MKNFYQTITTLAIPLLMAVGIFAALPLTAAASPASEVTDGLEAAGDSDAKNCGPEGSKRKCTLGDSIKTITNVLLFVIGAVAVIMIILGGIRYTTSNGDSSQITAAKNTILYAVIGLVVALLAYAIIDFVIVQFT